MIGVRACISGEGLSENGACFTCPKGTYLLIPPTVPTDCTVCQVSKSICLGGNKIGPKPGFWRKNNLTEVFIECFLSTSCL